MIGIPAFKAHLRPVILPGEGVLLLSEDGTTALYGPLFEKVAPLIDGVRSDDDIAAILAGELDAAKVYYTLALLEKDGHIAESITDMHPAQAGFWHGLGVDPRRAASVLRTARVRVLPVGGMDPGPLSAALADLRVTRTREAGESGLDLVITDDYLRDEIQDIAAEARGEGRRWMLLRPSGFEMWIGPVFEPKGAGCLACLRHKLMRHFLLYRFAVTRSGKEGLPLALLPGAERAACELAAIETVKVLAGAPDGLRNKVLSIDTRTWASRTHNLVLNPACPVCGTPLAREALPVQLTSRRVTFAEDGGHRTVPPEATLKRFEHLVSPITGVVKLLQRVSGTNSTAHVYIAGRNAAVRLERLEDLKKGLRNSSSGKGASEPQSRASALCEALERYSGEANGSEIRIPGTFREMREKWGEAVIHPNAVMLFSDRQYAERDAWNGRKSRFNRVPEPFAEDVRIDWTPVWSLTRECHKYLPTQLVYFTARSGGNYDYYYCIGCSNGNASGNTLEEAVLQGFFELVERDAVALWWYNRLTRPAVDVASFGDPWFMDLAAHYEAMGRELWVLDITSDLGIPAFAAFSAVQGQGPEERILFGLGCHFDARIALQRSLAEMNQIVCFARELDELGKMDTAEPEVLSWLKNATRSNRPYIVPNASKPRTRSDYPVLHTGDLLLDIQECRRLVEERGMEMLVLDQTRPDIGMPVVKVIVPGLRHFWARYAPGRLYGVPVEMGWLERPLAEDELNPIPIFF